VRYIKLFNWIIHDTFNVEEGTEPQRGGMSIANSVIIFGKEDTKPQRGGMSIEKSLFEF
jgi:hypothetical protein